MDTLNCPCCQSEQIQLCKDSNNPVKDFYKCRTCKCQAPVSSWQKRTSEWVSVEDNFGCQQLIKDILPNVRTVDIRIRMDGKYYWFEGDFLKQILPHVKFDRIEKDVDCKLKSHEEVITSRDLWEHWKLLSNG